MITRLINELQHRRVFRSVAAYAVVAWIAVEAADVIFPALGVPEAALTWLIVIALSGFPLVAVLAWIFDVTSGGVVLGTPAPESTNSISRLSQVSSWLLVLVLGAAVAYLSVRLYSEADDGTDFLRGKSIAVLPFKNIATDDSTNSVYFSDGVAEEILSGLSDVEGLRVAARASSFAYRDDADVRAVGEKLNVSTLLVGSVRLDQDAENVRITAQLIEAESGFQLWSDTFDYKLENVFAVQDEIAAAIVRELEVEFSGRKTDLIQTGTANVEAYKSYLQGRHFLQKETVTAIDQAIGHFDRAIELDPDYAQAYTGLADAWIGKRRIGNLSLFEATQQAHDAISSALRLNSELAEAQTSLGLCVLGAGEQRAAASQFAKAIGLDPDNVDAHLQRANLLRDQGFLEDATRAYTQALALDPLNSTIIAEQAILTGLQGRFERAFEQLESLLAEYPEGLSAVLAMSRVAALAGQAERSLQFAQRAQSLAPDNPIALTRVVDAYIQLGRLDDAEANLNQAQSVAPENESVRQVTLRFLLVAGRHSELQTMTTQRAQLFINSSASIDSKLRLERLVWAAIGRLSSGDSAGASELLERAMPSPISLDPHPQSIHYLALLTRSRMLEEKDQTAIAEALENGRVIAQRVQDQGWGTSDVDYALAALAAAGGMVPEALEHLQDAVKLGWRSFLFANQDPAMASLQAIEEYQALMQQVEKL
jgi:TolB-like protein/tetratricopeptide (TPR) repeat protein